jgi:hypothetical protein
MMQLLADPSKAVNFARIVFDLLVQGAGWEPLKPDEALTGLYWSL